MKKRNIIEFISFLVLVITIILTFVFSYLVVYQKSGLKVYEIFLSGIGIISFIIYIISKIKNLKFSIYEIFIFILMIFSCLSLINAKDVNIAIFGKLGRHEGLIAVLSYYSLFLTATNIKSKKYLKIIISSILTIGVLNCFYGLFQTGLLKSNIFKVRDSWTYAKGLLGNSMFFGTMMCLCYSLVLGIFYKIQKNKKNIFKIFLVIILLFIFSIGIIISGSMAVYVSVFAIILLLIYELIRVFIKSKKFNLKGLINILLPIIFLIISFLIFTKQTDLIQKDVNELKDQTINAIQGNVDDKFGTGRIYIWRRTIEKIIEAPITGFGIDNYRIAFYPALIDPMNGRVVDKAHNDYLQRMVCEGILSGFTYIVFLILIFIRNINKCKSSYHYGLFLAFTCYAIEIFFSISVTRVAPIYFIILGLLISTNEVEDAKN